METQVRRSTRAPSWIVVAAVTVGLPGIAGLISCGSHAKGPSQISVTGAPRAVALDHDGRVRIRFSRPLVEAAQVGAALTELPFTIEPAVRTNARWEDRFTLAIQPLDALANSTRYVVALRGQLADRADERVFAFVNRPLEVTEHQGLDVEMAPPRPEVTLVFNQEVRAGDVAARCVIQGDRTGGGKPVAMVAEDPARTSKQVTIKAVSDLGPNRDLDLRCEGLVGVGGNVPMLEPYTLGFRTYPTFQVVQVKPQAETVPADEVTLELRFSTPVEASTLGAALVARPEIRGLARGWTDDGGRLYTVEVELDGATEYTIELPASAKDAFGQKLGKPVSFSFRTGDARPRISLERGIYAVETTAPGYPVWTRNVRSFEVTCGQVPRDRIAKLLTADMDYDPWYGASDTKPIDWDGLGVKARHLQVRVAAERNQWHQDNVALHQACGGMAAAGDRRGLFLASISSDETKVDPDYRYAWRYPREQRVLANVTDLGMLLKVGPASGLVWIASIAKGGPVAGARVTVYTPQGKQVATATTDADGLARLAGSARLLPAAGRNADVPGEAGEDFDAYRDQRLIVVAEKDGDLAVVDGNWSNGIQIWNFGVPEDRRGGGVRVRGFIQSDRGIYRPGEGVHFKGLVREIAAGQSPRVPPGARVDLHVEDSRGQAVFDRRQSLSPFGGFAMDLTLGADAPLGDYYVTATVKGQTFRERFQVEEFRKVEYELKLGGAASEKNLRVGQPLAFDLAATYLFGAPVAGAAVRFNVERRPHVIEFRNFADYAFEDTAREGYWETWWMDREERPQSFVADGEGVTDAAGHYGFVVTDPSKDLTGPQDYLVQTTVTDATDQAVSKQVAVVAHRSEFYVGLHAQEYVQAVGKPFGVNTVALTPDGRQLATDANLSFARQVTRCESRGAVYSWRDCKTELEPVWTRKVTLPASGNGSERIDPKEPGEYVIRLEATDRGGNRVVASTFVWVIGKGEAFWSGDESARMSLVASKQEYRPGETARLVPRTSLPGGTALVTLERDGLIDAFVTKLQSSGEGIEIPLTVAHAPNVYASVALVKGRTGEGDRNRPGFQMGVVDLKVSAEEQRLQVAVSAEQPSYEPGQTVKGRIRVTQAGKPVKAEVSLSVADEGVLQLIAYQTPDPMAAFYAPWGLGVESATTWNRIARIADPNARSPEEGGDGPAGPGARVRSKFVSSAFWASSLVTDGNGEAEFAFTAPDNLTAFRMMAVAADTGARFGSGDARLTVTKPVLLQAALPRFFAESDRGVVGFIVHNRTSEPGTVQVAAKAEGVELAARGPLSLRLAAGESARVDFDVAVTSAAALAATFEASAVMGGSRDDLRVTVPISHRRVIEKTSLWRGPIDGKLQVPVAYVASGILPKESSLAITVDRTGMAELEGSLRYLIEYPYGCLEQTLSGFIPLVKVRDLAASLDLEGLRGPKLEGYIRAGTAKVLRHQHADGLFSLWPSSQTYPQLSAYALYGLLEAKKAGAQVDPAAVARGLVAVRKWANAPQRKLGTGGEGATVAMTAYVLAANGKPDAGLTARLFEARRGLPIWGQAFLLRALKLGKTPAAQADTLRNELLAGLVVDKETALIHEIPQNQATWDDTHMYMSSDTRTTAIVLSALIETGAGDETLAKLAEGLKRKQRPGGHWSNTQENIYSLIALADYARRRSAGETKVRVTLDGQPLVTQTIKGNTVLRLTRRLDEIKPGTLLVETDGRAIASVRLETARVDAEAGAVDRGFAIRRQILDPESKQPVSAYKTGQLLRVRVEVTTPVERSYVALVDPLPAGLEPVNSALATSQADREEAQPGWWWEPKTWTWIELRDDRVQAFADRMPAGTHEVEYLVRATMSGRFAAAPATAEAMYEPDIRGRSAAGVVSIAR